MAASNGKAPGAGPTLLSETTVRTVEELSLYFGKAEASRLLAEAMRSRSMSPAKFGPPELLQLTSDVLGRMLGERLGASRAREAVARLGHLANVLALLQGP